eukprot:COSAG01_NODE_75604_length_194_cov_79.389474_1_plen_50_part_01
MAAIDPAFYSHMFLLQSHPPGYLLSCTFVDTHVGAGEGRCSVLSWHLHLG